MTYALRPARLLLLIALGLALVLASLAGGAPAATALSEGANAAALKKCKAGWNKKKCRCPANKRRIKRDGRYRCKKKAVTNPQEGTNTDPGTTTNPETNTNTGVGGEQIGGQGANLRRDDAAYAAQLGGSRFGPLNSETTYGGLSTYQYDFCPSGSFSHTYDYFNSSFGQGQSVYSGSWQVEQGYEVVSSPVGPGWAGIVVMRETDGTASRIEIDFNNTIGVFTVGNAAHLNGGQYPRQFGLSC